MRHLAEDELVLYHYHDGDDIETAKRHLASCAECRSRLAAIEEVLNLVVASSLPERGPGYGSEVWNRIRAELPELTTRQQSWVIVPRWTWAGVVAVLLLVAFLVGRYGFQKGSSKSAATNSSFTTASSAPEVRERILMLAVGDHLDRSQMLLVELTHASGSKEIDISSEQQRAIELADANRLYRTSAQQVGDATILTLLDQLERLLMDVGHQPNRITAGELKRIQDSIQSQGILFRVRVVRTNLHKDAQGPRTTPSQKKGQTT